jgi:heme/copper-type cytochrome/quinol oxidase subunit 2
MRYVEIMLGLLGTLLVTCSLIDRVDARGVTPQGHRPVVAIDVVAKRFSYTPDRYEVTRGDHVRITVRSADGTHGFAIKKLRFDVEVPRGGEPVVLEFDADQAGEFPVTCSEYCGRGHHDMEALLVVREPGAAASR